MILEKMEGRTLCSKILVKFFTNLDFCPSNSLFLMKHEPKKFIDYHQTEHLAKEVLVVVSVAAVDTPMIMVTSLAGSFNKVSALKKKQERSRLSFV